MTNEQAVLAAEAEINRLKGKYSEYLTPIVLRIHEKDEEPKLEELIKCQKLGTEYFNYIENFVGNSGLLGAHANGKWVTGFAETCHSVLHAYVIHANFLDSYSQVLKGRLSPPSPNAYANMQRMTKEYLGKENCKNLEAIFKKNSLPTTGFTVKGASDMSKTPKWQLVVCLVVGITFALLILGLVVFIPNPTPTQFFIFRGSFAIAAAAIAAIIPGLLKVESRFQEFPFRASGAIVVFTLVWQLNPPALIGS